MGITGIIRPPPDIRAVADKTALFVSKNGRAFENRILNSEKGQTPKFAFLHENSPFHAYYEDRIQFYKDGGTDEKKESKESEDKEEKKKEQQLAVIQKPATQTEKKSAHDPVAKALLRQRNIIRDQYDEAEKLRKENKDDITVDDKSPIVIRPPPRLHHVTIAAPSNMTAVQVETIKLVAQFIALDESKNFLQNLTIREWNNPIFAFLQPRHPHFAYFSALADCYKHIVQSALKQGFKAQSLDECLDLAAYRAEYERDANERKQQGDGEDEQLNTIDWHDFVVVETIDFDKNEVVQPIAMPIEVDAMEQSDDEDGETIRVVSNYTPKVVASGQTSKAQTHVIDPITGKIVPADQTSEHMRIQLLDPKWADEKRKFQEKQKESNLVAGDTIASNLSRVVGAGSSAHSELRPDPKRHLDDVNREFQSQQLGPMLPPPQEPQMKRLRLDPSQLPPPPPPTISAYPAMPPLPPPGMPPLPPPGMPPLPPPGMPPLPPPGMPPMPPPGMPPMPPPGMPLLPPPAAYGMHGQGMPPILPPGMQSQSVPPQPFDPVGIPPISQDEVETELLSEEEFAASLPSPTVTLEIAIPHDPSSQEWNFMGQSVSLSVNVMAKIKAIKEELSASLNNISINKLQLKHSQQGFLKDNMSLAQLNLGPLVSLEMVPKTRGRRK